MTDNDQRILERLPHVIRRMAEIAGLESALRIAREFAGEEICIPKLDSLHREIRDVEIRRLYDSKEKTVRELVRKYSLTERQIYNILNNQPEDDKTFTLPLF